ncbi:NAD-dependent epimerase/dehydratase family protein [Candidatus Peregrinibacteria bacterium]|nr:NAD-dependent epimerase/dehydratase family protein [Candidatus Peregrinibacteria bacterium]
MVSYQKKPENIRRVLVTGGAGCIGIAVCKELRKRGLEVHLFDLPEQIMRMRKAIPDGAKICYGSLLDISSIREGMDQCDAVLHLAAYLGVRRTEMNKLRCLEINVEGTKNILECAVQHQLKKIVFASSSEVYGDPEKNPIDETTPVHGKTVYAISKLMGEELCKAYSQRYPNLQFVILRYFNAYGPYQAAQFVIPKFIQQVLKDEAPTVNGDGMQRRSYCYVSDTAWATVEALLLSNANGQVINVGNDESLIELKELAHRIISITGKEGKIKPVFDVDFKNADRDRTREIVERYCDTRKARTLLNFHPKVSLEEGIRKVIESETLFEQWATTELAY